MSKPSSKQSINRRRRRRSVYVKLKKQMRSAKAGEKKQIEAKLFKIAPWMKFQDFHKE